MTDETINAQFLRDDLARAAGNHFKGLFPSKVIDVQHNADGTATVTKACSLTGFVSKETHPADMPVKAAMALGLTAPSRDAAIAGLKTFFNAAIHAGATALEGYFQGDEIAEMLTELGVKLVDAELGPAAPDGPSQNPAA